MKTATVLLVLLLSAQVGFGQTSREKWQTKEDISSSNGGPRGDDTSGAVIVSGPNTIVAGSVLRAYNKATGELQWEDPWPSLAVGALGSKVYAIIALPTPDPTRHQFLLRAYDNTTGGVLQWQAAIPDSQTLLINDNAVIAGGNAYDPVDGRPLWSLPGARVVALDGFRAITASTSGAFDNQVLTLRSYDARLGTLNWTSTHNIGAAQISAFASATGRLYMTGWYETTSAPRAVVAAFETGSGDLLWNDITRTGWLRYLAIRRNKLVVVGQGPTVNAIIRTYDAEAGLVLWQDETVLPPPVVFGPFAFGYHDVAYTVAISDDAVYYGGNSGLDTFWTEWMTRAHNLDSGRLIFEERLNRSTNKGLTSFVSGIALDSGIVILAGDVLGQTNEKDRAVKAYDFSDVEVSQLNALGQSETPARTRVRR